MSYIPFLPLTPQKGNTSPNIQKEKGMQFTYFQLT
jgi:hypothetical protein